MVHCISRRLGCERSRVQCQYKVPYLLTYLAWLKHTAKSNDTFNSYTESAATIAHLARHQYQAAPAGSTSRQHQQAAPWAAPAAPWSLWPPASSCIPKHWRTYLCFHSETDSSNNCGYVVLNQWLRLRKGVKDTLRNSHHRVASKTRTLANIPAVSWLKGDRGVLYWNTR